MLSTPDRIPMTARSRARRSGRHRRSQRRFLGVSIAMLLMAATAGEVGAQAPLEAPTAVVTMGDSYISGEAGRWDGNSSGEYGSRRGTDRAASRVRWRWRYDPSSTYGSSGATGCHRSDVAPVLSSAIEVDELVNLSCSGADTANLIRAVSGGVGLKGEAPQADQLAVVAASHDVEMIVVSIGGNDLGFGSLIVQCAFDYLLSPVRPANTCNEAQQQDTDAKMAGAMDDVGVVVDEIMAVMAEAGDDDYRLVLQSYPSPVPSGDEFRYRELGVSRTLFGHCPYWNADATWARDSFVPQLSANLAAVAASRGVEFLDLQDALEGREICAKTTARGSGANASWARFLTTGLLQGEAQESLHPNALGQQANGTCLRLLYASSPGSYRCDNVAGSGPDVMTLTSL